MPVNNSEKSDGTQDNEMELGYDNYAIEVQFS